MRDAQLRPRILRIQACLSGCLDSNGLSLTCLGSHQHVASSCLTLCHALCSGLARLRPSSGPWLPFPAPRAFLLCSHGLVRTLPCCFQSYLVLVRNGFLDDSLPHWGHSPCGLLVPAQQLPGLCFRAGSVFTCQCPCLGVVAPSLSEMSGERMNRSPRPTGVPNEAQPGLAFPPHHISSIHGRAGPYLSCSLCWLCPSRVQDRVIKEDALSTLPEPGAQRL